MDLRRKIAGTALASVIIAAMAGCAQNSSSITVISREDGSGTRGAFIELLGIEQEDPSGKKEDMTRADAEISQSTSVVIQSVKDDPNAIGYISLGSLNDSVKAVKVDGVEPSAQTVQNGTYKISRPFVVCYKEDSLTELGAELLTFILSESEGAYTPAGFSGNIVISGSTSVAPVMEKLADAYKHLNENVTIEVQQTGSGAGITAATEGACEIGMSSRSLKQAELDEGLTAKTIANDGIAVIVNKENARDDLASSQLRDIYLGNINTWDELN